MFFKEFGKTPSYIKFVLTIFLCPAFVGCGGFNAANDTAGTTDSADGASQNDSINRSSTGDFEVYDLILVDTTTGRNIKTLSSQDKINLAELPKNLTIKAKVSSDVLVTKAYVNGKEPTRLARESFSLLGLDSKDKYLPYSFKTGIHEIEFKPAKRINGSWTTGTGYSISLNIVEETEAVDPVEKGPNSINSLILINAQTGKEIRVLNSNNTIDYSELPNDLTIKAKVTSDVGVTIALVNGKELDRKARESMSLAGLKSDGSYIPYNFEDGSQSITFIPSSKSSGSWKRGEPYTIALNVMGAEVQTPSKEYEDDTHKILETNIDGDILEGDFGYSSFQFDAGDLSKPENKSYILDARNAVFNVANSKNRNPTYNKRCGSGSLPINRYPLKIYNLDNVHVVGGLLDGSDIPQGTDWSPTYCNSAAVLAKKGARNVTIDGVRLTGAWDGFAMATDSPGMVVKNSWISGVRDDVIENDLFFNGAIVDSLVDDTFQGFSMQDPNNRADGRGNKMRVNGTLMRLKEVLYKGGQRLGSFFKTVDKANVPDIEVKNTVLAVEYEGGSIWGHYWEGSWKKISNCSNNLFLWISDKPIPSAVHPELIPSCFKIVKGEEARSLWFKHRKNWINCHPKVQRTQGDPNSKTSECNVESFGGYGDQE